MDELTDKQGHDLLMLAREAISARLGRKIERKLEEDEALHEQRGTFVTLKKAGDLRGCIGNIEPIRSILNGVCENAISAAFHDHRFSPLTVEELGEIHISISILTEARDLQYTDAKDLCRKIRPGIDGVILRFGRASSTFLPQVWEQLPDVEQFLSQLCIKAGVSKECWRREKVEIQVYQVQSFAERRQ